MDNNQPVQPTPIQQPSVSAAPAVEPVITIPTPVSPPSPTPEQQPKGKGKLILVGIVLFITMLLLGGLFILSSQKKQVAKITPVVPTPTIVVIPTTTTPTTTDPLELEKETNQLTLGELTSEFAGVDKELTSQ